MGAEMLTSPCLLTPNNPTAWNASAQGEIFGIIGGEGRQAMSNYMAIIHKEPNGWYSAEVPALPGCYTDGATLDEIHFNLKEAIQLYLQDQPENVEPVEMMQVCV